MPPAPSTQSAFRFIFQSTYKGGTRQWSTKMYTNQTIDPTDSIMSALQSDQQAYILPAFPTWCTWIGLDGYSPGSDVPVKSLSFSHAGTFAPGTSTPTPLECAAYFRFSTTQRTSKNHPVYLGQYLHDVMYQPSSSDHELLQTDQTENMRQWLTRWVSGITVSGTTYKKAGPYGAVAQSLLVPTYITHRDFPT